MQPVDPELRLISTQIYNDAMGEMQAESGDRLLSMAVLPWWDIKLALAEAERCAAMGMRGININSDPQLHGMARPVAATTGRRCGSSVATRVCR